MKSRFSVPRWNSPKYLSDHECKSNFFRHNIATQEWVVFSTGRRGRPKQFESEVVSESNLHAFDKSCPFCAGNEHLTSAPTYSYGQGRVIRNKYPVVQHSLEENKTLKPLPLLSQREKSQFSAFGYHEVIIETPVHNEDLLHGGGIDYVETMLMCFLERGKMIARDDRVQQILMFKNNGKNAGASIKHSHSQIVGLPIIPSSVSQNLANAKVYFENHKECPFCHMIAEEINDSLSEEHNRVINKSPNFLAFLPYASRIPNQVWILPLVHEPSFFDILPSQVHELSVVVLDVMQKLKEELGKFDFNLVVQTAPVNQTESLDFENFYHWYLEIVQIGRAYV